MEIFNTFVTASQINVCQHRNKQHVGYLKNTPWYYYGLLKYQTVHLGIFLNDKILRHIFSSKI